MPTIGEAYKKAYEKGKDRGVTPIDLRLLLVKDEGLKEQIDVILDKDREMKTAPLFESQVNRLIQGEPVEYVINQASFLGHELYVDKRVLIPRSETEELVAAITEKISDYFDPRNYLVCADIGTGSGAIAIALKEFFPHWILLASDTSKDALEVAKKNFESTNTRAEVYLGDALTPYIDNRINLDIIVSNPPYIENKENAQASVRDYEPASALWLDKSHSVYESIFKNCLKVKKGSLFMAFEISPDLVDWLAGMMNKEIPGSEFCFRKDLNGLERFLFVYLK